MYKNYKLIKEQELKDINAYGSLLKHEKSGANVLLLKNDDEKLELTGTIKTTKNISDIDLKIKLSLQYEDELGEIREIYYETT